MNIALEKEKIKRALAKIDDARIIFGIIGYIEQYDPNDEMAENYIPQKARTINIEKEKENIIKAIDSTKEKSLLGGLKWFVLLYDPNDSYTDLKTAPIASWEVSMPFGRKLTRKQFNAHLDLSLNDDAEGYTMDEVMEHIKLNSAERKKIWDEM